MIKREIRGAGRVVISRFSIVELMVVILIIAGLLALGVNGYRAAQRKMAETRTRAMLERIKLALEAYKAKFGYYIQAYDTTSGGPFFRLDAIKYGQDNFTQFISYRDLAFYDPKGYVNNLPKGNAFVIDAFSGAKPDAESGRTNSLIKYTCPATDAAFELRSSGFDRKWNTKDDIVVK